MRSPISIEKKSNHMTYYLIIIRQNSGWRDTEIFEIFLNHSLMKVQYLLTEYWSMRRSVSITYLCGESKTRDRGFLRAYQTSYAWCIPCWFFYIYYIQEYMIQISYYFIITLTIITCIVSSLWLSGRTKTIGIFESDYIDLLVK